MSPGANARNGASASTEPGVAAVADLVGDKWSMLLVRALFRGIHRFDDLQADLGISRAILAARLKELNQAGIVDKIPYQQRPTRYEYVLTPMGVELSPALVALVRWGNRYFGDADHRTVLVHAPCDTEFEQGFWCETCQTTFGPPAIKARRD
ncbi:MAG: helix-turn-helix domain-containing protein [Ilumatobacteraceae bacterium]